MITYTWSPLLYFCIMMSFNYPTSPENYNIEHNNYKSGFIQNAYYLFIRLQFILPCGACRDNLVNNLNTLKFKENKNKILKDRDHFQDLYMNYMKP